MIDVQSLDPPPAGFGRCRSCDYRDVSRTVRKGNKVMDVCYACTMQTVRRVPEQSCDVCCRELDEDGECGNPVCSWSEADRNFGYSRALSQHTGAMKTAIARYKYDGRKGWAWIFSRVLAGYLDAHRREFERFDLIVPSPTYVGKDGRSWDHTALIIETAAEQPSVYDWPFETEVIIKTAATEPLVGKRWPQRYEIATEQIRPALQVPDPSAMKGKRILVFDDVFTEGLTICEVAGALRRAGAKEVCEVVLARQPWAGPK